MSFCCFTSFSEQRRNAAADQLVILLREFVFLRLATTMPAKSRAQQKAAGAALAATRVKQDINSLRGASKSMYEAMSEKKLDEMASTKRKGKPECVQGDFEKSEIGGQVHQVMKVDRKSKRPSPARQGTSKNAGNGRAASETPVAQRTLAKIGAPPPHGFPATAPGSPHPDERTPGTRKHGSSDQAGPAGEPARPTKKNKN